MERILYSRALKWLALLAAGPLGCSILYYVYFIIRPFDAARYPSLALYLEAPSAFLEIALLTAVFAVGIVFLRTQALEPFTKSNQSLPTAALATLTIITAGLMALTFYRVLGTLDPGTAMENYARYYAVSRIGGAWIIWLGYGILFVLLADMFFGGVSLQNSISFLTCILLNSVTGGRTLPLLLMLAFLFLVYFQNPRLWVMIVAVAVCVAISTSSYLFVSSLRADGADTPQRETNEPLATNVENPTSNWHTLNYDAAFILDDVARRLEDGSLRTEGHALNNFNLFVPRFINSEKLKSDSETRLVYPDVAARGTTISFPLKANIMLHLGGGATFYLSWLVVGLFQLGLIWAIAQRQRGPNLPAFIAFYFGSVYFLIERAGVFNTRLLIHLAILVAAYGCYRAATSPHVLALLSFGARRKSTA